MGWMRAAASICALGMFAAACERVAPATGSSRAAASPAPTAPTTKPGPDNPAIVVSNRLGFVFQKGTEGSLETVPDDRGWAVVDGAQKLESRTTGVNVDRKLRIDHLLPPDGSVIVQVNLSPSGRTSAFVRALESAEPSGAPVLEDSSGIKYPAIGFVYKTPDVIHLRYSKGHPLEHMSEAPGVSASMPDRQLVLFFGVTEGVRVHQFRVGTSVVEIYDPQVEANRKTR